MTGIIMTIMARQTVQMTTGLAGLPTGLTGIPTPEMKITIDVLKDQMITEETASQMLEAMISSNVLPDNLKEGMIITVIGIQMFVSRM
jgi:hypothetical protein